MITAFHNKKDGVEYVTVDEAKELSKTHSFVVVGFILAGEGELLYKGEDEAAAKTAWLRDSILGNILFCQYGGFCSEFRFSLDVSDVEYKDAFTDVKGVSYPIFFFDKPIDGLGEAVRTKELQLSGEDVWYVVRVFDIDLKESSFIGQVVYKGTSKQEAVDAWRIEDTWQNADNDMPRNYYIFNPSETQKEAKR